MTTVDAHIDHRILSNRARHKASTTVALFGFDPETLAYSARFRAALAEEYAATEGEQVFATEISHTLDGTTLYTPARQVPAERWPLAYSRALARVGMAGMPFVMQEALRGNVLAHLKAELN